MARLEVTIDPRPASAGARVVKRDLDDIKRRARDVERGTDRLSRTSRRNFQGMARNNKQLASSFTNVASSIAVMHGPLGGVASRVSAIGETIRRIGPAALGMVGAVAAAFSVRPIFAFQDALAEVSTLVDTATFDMQGLRDAALEQSAAFGGAPQEQAKAFYQIISAGASTAAEATETLTAANKLAVGGVTSVQVAADGLTSVLNAYGDRVESATAVSDALFVGMRAGKTTIEELSQSLGKVAPLAASTGVSFDELVASVSALTKGGIDTRIAVTGVRAVLASVAKPTKEASNLAAQLGLEFNAAALEAKGLRGFLDELVSATGGSTEQLAQLFGGVEALVPIMALAGGAGEDMAAILEDMGVKAGETEKAFNKMANSPGFQAKRLWSSLLVEINKIGGAMGSMLVPIMRELADAMETIAKVAKVAGAALLTAFGGTILAAVRTLTIAIGTTLVGALRAVAVAAAANPLGAFIVALVTVITAVWQFRDEVKSALAEVNAEIEQQLGINAAEHAKRGSNDMMNAFRAAFDVVSTTWRQLPGVVAGAAIGGVNAVNRWTSRMVQSAIDGINTVIEAVNTLPETFGFTGLSTIPDFGGLPQVPNPWAETVQTWMGEVNEIVDRNMSRDWFEEARASASETTPVVENLSTKVNDLVSKLDDAAAAAAGVGTASKDATDKMEAGLSGLPDMWRDIQDEAQRAAEETARFWRDTTGGFVSDLRSGVEQGKGLWRSFADAATRAIDRVTDALLNQMLDAIFKVNSAATGGGRGGLFGGILSGIGGLFGRGGPSASAVAGARGGAQIFAKGGAFSGGNELTTFARGGIVNKPILFPMARGMGLMGEAGPEAVMPLRRGSDGRLGVETVGRGGGGRNVEVTIEGSTIVLDGGQASPEELRRQLDERDRRNRQEIMRQITTLNERNPNWLHT